MLFGAVYALLFALGRLRRSTLLLRGSYLAYGLLAVAALFLSRALSLSGFWHFVIAVALVGYLLLPQAIWHLCVGTHATEDRAGTH